MLKLIQILLKLKLNPTNMYSMKSLKAQEQRDLLTRDYPLDKMVLTKKGDSTKCRKILVRQQKCRPRHSRVRSVLTILELINVSSFNVFFDNLNRVSSASSNKPRISFFLTTPENNTMYPIVSIGHTSVARTKMIKSLCGQTLRKIDPCFHTIKHYPCRHTEKMVHFHIIRFLFLFRHVSRLISPISKFTTYTFYFKSLSTLGIDIRWPRRTLIPRRMHILDTLCSDDNTPCTPQIFQQLIFLWPIRFIFASYLASIKFSSSWSSFNLFHHIVYECWPNSSKLYYH